MRKPRLTNNIITGLIEMGAVVEAGGVDDYTGYDDKEAQAMMDRAMKALKWARAMRRYREAKALLETTMADPGEDRETRKKAKGG